MNTTTGQTPGSALRDLTEQQLLDRLFPVFAAVGEHARVLVGPGDDAAVLATDAATVITTDAMVRDRDWRDDWSGPADVGAKVVAQNLADVAAMGARPTGLVVTLLADPATPVAWVLQFAQGLAAAAAAADCAVLGGDLSSAPAGSLSVSVTALGSLEGRAPVLRSGARVGDRIAVAGSLGTSGAGLVLLQEGIANQSPDVRALADELIAWHRRPIPPLAAGPQAADAGASAMLDLSDGLLRDGARIAAASGVRLDFSRAALSPYAARLAAAVGADDAWQCVLGGGEEHSLLACFPGAVPPGWVPIGTVQTGSGVSVDGVGATASGWDHFHPQATP